MKAGCNIDIQPGKPVSMKKMGLVVHKYKAVYLPELRLLNILRELQQRKLPEQYHLIDMHPKYMCMMCIEVA
jgi:hypothetical protein